MFHKIQKILNDSFEGKPVKIRGWVYRKRDSGSICFIVLRDSTNIIQATVKKNEVDEKTWKNISESYIETHVEVEGTVKKDERAPTGFELKVSKVKITSKSQPFPIAKDNSEEFLLDIRHLWLRSREQNAIMKIKSNIFKSIRNTFYKEGFFEVTPPIIVSSATEGGSTLFELDYFGKKAFLSQSSQLYLESLIFNLDKVFAITPSFRAEKSRTTRHLAEYWHVEPEAAYYDLDDTIDLAEKMLQNICKDVIKENSPELVMLGRTPDDLKISATEKADRITYDEAIKWLQEKDVKINWGDDLGTEEERILTQDRKKPVFVTHYPKEIKSFYMKENPKNKKTVLNCDCLAPEGYGEIIGGSQREDDYERLLERINATGGKPEDYAWYLDLRKYGSIPHSGYGLGVERVVRWICKLEHIRDTIPYPRTINRSYP